jgi:16S rRNA processing protein RimM
MNGGNENKYLECGKIINTHGVKGGIKIESWCDSPETLAELTEIYFKKGDSYEMRKVLSSTVMKRHVMAYIEGVTDIDSAAALKETVIYADRDDIPLDEGDYFIIDLVGLPVIDADSGVEYG